MNKRLNNVWQYVFPSVGSMAITFLYVVVDGIFVGRGIGAHALAAINIVLPFNVMVMAVASMLVVGGSTVFSIRAGRGDPAAANDAFLTSGLMILGVSVVLSAIGVFWPWQVARLSGATDALVDMAAIYTRYYCLFTPVFMGSVFLAQFIRNDGAPVLAFWGMVTGALANIFFDWLFVFPMQMGVKGAAIASGIGQILSLGILSIHFCRHRGILQMRTFSCSGALMVKILKRGLPEMVSQLAQPMTVFMYNWVVIRSFGEMGVAALSIIMYLASVLVNGIFQGVSQGIQPLLGRSFGRGDARDVQYYFRAGLLINLAFAMGSYGVFRWGGDALIGIFTSNQELVAMTYSILRVYGWSFVFASAGIVLTTYFFSTKQTAASVAIALARGMVLNTAFILLFPRCFGPHSVWYAIVAAEAAALLLALCLKHTGNQLESARVASHPPAQNGIFGETAC